MTSILLYLRGAGSGNVVALGVEIARAAMARIRGLTLVDTRRSQEACLSESAVYAEIAQRRQAILEKRHVRLRRDLSDACLDADLDFDLRRVVGDPFKVLPRESQFHDLVVTSLGGSAKPRRSVSEGGRELTRLLQAGMRPLLVVPPIKEKIARVLLAYDGSEASGQAIRSFFDLDPVPDAEIRLLAVGPNETAARHSLRDMADYCASRRRRVETGCLRGTFRRVLAPFAAHWQADLVVLGVPRQPRLLPTFSTPCDWMRLTQQDCGLYLHC